MIEKYRVCVAAPGRRHIRRDTVVPHARAPGFCDRVTVLLLAYVSQISRPVEASQALVSSSRLTIPSLPDGGRCCGQTSKMWSTVCSGAPHSQTEESLRPHFSMDELNRPTPVRRRLRVVHCFRGLIRSLATKASEEDGFPEIRHCCAFYRVFRTILICPIMLQKNEGLLKETT